MKTTALAIVHPTIGQSGDDNVLCSQLWAQTTALLQPMLGKFYGRFEPAVHAWNQSVDRPYGIIFGRTDPALFLYFYATGKAKQEQSVHYHMGGLMENFNIGEKFENEKVTGLVMSLTPGKEKDISAHLLWHLGMMSGELLPDAGIYYAPGRQAVISEKLDEQILGDIGCYAISMVRFCSEAGMDENT